MASFDDLMAKVERERAERAAKWPDDKTALRALAEVYQCLKDLGWNDGIYAPKDGTEFEVIQLGSTGIFRCCRVGDFWTTYDCGDSYPSHNDPDMFRPLR